ncbi:hypothetical protein KUTeg_011150, partial [Tegillarca granosa]
DNGTEDLDVTIPACDSDSPAEDTQQLVEKHPGYCFVWDNVQVLSHVRHQTSEKQNKLHLWALAFACRNRIGFRHLSEQDTRQATTMSLHLFLPEQDDYEKLRARMIVIDMRILKKYLQIFADCEVNQHIPHDYSEESSKRSRIINLGIFDHNPSTTACVISIMNRLHMYIPRLGENHFFPVLCHGDGLSVERMRDAKAARAASATKERRLESLEPVPQEFHKRCIILQDLFDDMYSSSSGADRGTLFHIRNNFNHRNVTKSVGNCFNHAVDLLEFSTEGLVILLAMQICGITKKSSSGVIPPDKKLDEYLSEVAEEVVSTVWHQVPLDDIYQVLDSDDPEEDLDDDESEYFEFCFCKDGPKWFCEVCTNHKLKQVKEDYVYQYSCALL